MNTALDRLEAVVAAQKVKVGRLQMLNEILKWAVSSRELLPDKLKEELNEIATREREAAE